MWPQRAQKTQKGNIRIPSCVSYGRRTRAITSHVHLVHFVAMTQFKRRLKEPSVSCLPELHIHYTKMELRGRARYGRRFLAVAVTLGPPTQG